MSFTSEQNSKIKEIEELFIQRLIKNPDNLAEETSSSIVRLSTILRGESEYAGNSLIKDNFFRLRDFRAFITLILNDKALVGSFDLDHPMVKEILTIDVNANNYWIWPFIINKISSLDIEGGKPWLDQLLAKGFDDDEILTKAYAISPNAFIREGEYGEEDTALGDYYKDKLNAVHGLFKVKKEGKFKLLNDLFNSTGYSNLEQHKANLFKYLYYYAYKSVKDNILDYAVTKVRNNPSINFEIAKFLIFKEGDEYTNSILRLIDKYEPDQLEAFALMEYMNENCERNYDSEIIRYGDGQLGRLAKLSINSGQYYSHKNLSQNFIPYYFDFLKKKGIDVLSRMESYFGTSKVISNVVVNYTEKELKEKSLALIFGVLSRSEVKKSHNFIDNLTNVLDKYDCTPFFETILLFAEEKATKLEVLKLCATLATKDTIIPFAIELLNGNRVSKRLLGARILGGVKGNVEVEKLLETTLENEKNDETRNTILEATKNEKFKNQYSIDKVKETVLAAKARKKLDKWNEKWIDEPSLPKLFWTNGKTLDQDEVRFLIYRMKQAKAINSDPEAKQMILNLDSEKSEKMALFLLQSFINSNSDSKLKYYLTLCGLLGNDNVLNKLNALFRKCITDKRVKMAEYVLGAISMIGSDKALRIIEVISRKYASKKPKLSEAALAALEIAAEELNITKDQLADRIIPNFGFEGIYKEFEVEEETYRAFINEEFGLSYVNEDNKIRKSIPPKATPAFKKEFKEIAKEVRDVVKSQADRLERYMINERSWEGEEWKIFFFNNPIMFVYALKLLWAIFDDKGKIKSIFYCDEDALLFDVNDDEIEINKTDKVRIFHPLMVDEMTRKLWKDKIYELGLKTVFPVMERSLFMKNNSELKQNFTAHFMARDISKGADFVAPQLLKRAWTKSTGDGGYLEFLKYNADRTMFAHANIEGPAVYYQGGTAIASVHEISFHAKQWNEKVLIETVPEIFYSEVLADIHSLIQAQ